MNIYAVYVEVAEAVRSIPSLKAHPFPADAITPDAFEMNLPEHIDYLSMGDASVPRGKTRLSVGANLFVGRLGDREAARRLLQYTQDEGPRSIELTINSHKFDTCDFVKVVSSDFGQFPVGAVTYLGATFTLDIMGRKGPSQ